MSYNLDFSAVSDVVDFNIIWKTKMCNNLVCFAGGLNRSFRRYFTEKYPGVPGRCERGSSVVS